MNIKWWKKILKNYIHEIPFVYTTAIHRQSDPVLEWALTIVTKPGAVPNGKEKNTGPVKRIKCRRIYGRASTNVCIVHNKRYMKIKDLLS